MQRGQLRASSLLSMVAGAACFELNVFAFSAKGLWVVQQPLHTWLHAAFNLSQSAMRIAAFSRDHRSPLSE
eukprot:67256-Rhodomonas_salina.1